MPRAARQHPRLAEAAALTLALGALASIVYGTYVMRGGFLSDSWSYLAVHELAPGNRFLGASDVFLDVPVLQPRPLYAIYLSGLHALLGAHMGFWLAWLVASGVAMSVAVYALLRSLTLGRIDAGVIATLLLIFPATTSIRLWATMVHAPVTVVLAALGFLAAFRAFDAERPTRGASWHAISLALFVASALLYEVTLPIMFASVLCYRVRAPWGRAARRWLVDCAVLAPIAWTITRSGPAQVQDTSGAVDHATAIAEGAWTLLTTVVLPVGADRWYAMALVGLVPLVAILVVSRLPSADPDRLEVRRWLLAGLGGGIIVVLGYSIFVPGIDYYTPLQGGIGNRVNTVPGIGWVLIVYAAIRLTMTIAIRGLRIDRRLTTAGALAASVVIAVGWLQAVARDTDTFERAYREGQRVAAVVTAAIPEPRRNSTIWTFGQPVQIAPGVPVFGNPWDMTHRVQLAYRDPTISSFVGYTGTRFDCKRSTIAPHGHSEYRPDDPGYGLLRSPYGRTYFVETTTGRVERIDSPSQCRRAAKSYPRSPD